MFFRGRGTLGMKRKILRHVRRFLRGLVILKRHSADYYICSQFQVLLKHSVVPLAHVYAGLDLSMKKRKEGKKKKERKIFVLILAESVCVCVQATFNDPINFNEKFSFLLRSEILRLAETDNGRLTLTRDSV